MEKRKKMQIAVATHIKCTMPDQACYFPLHVGREIANSNIQNDYIGDNTGIHISEKNPHFCELTGLFWMWKNLHSDYVGLVHYRRYFRALHCRAADNPLDKILKEEEALKLLEQYDMILPRKRYYLIETIFSHYSHTHYAEHLECMRKILMKDAPDYVEAFDSAMKRRSAHMYNMFIMKRDMCNSYCQWLFPLLFELEKQIDFEQYTPYQARLIGRIGEVMLDVWIEKNKMTYYELPVVYIGKNNFRKKAVAFLKAKFFGVKYDGSF